MSGGMPAALIPLDYVRSGARGRAAAAGPAERRRRRGDARRARRDGVLGRRRRRPCRTAPTRTPRRTTRRRAATRASWRCSTAALERDLPTLAVCRGVQLLNVARGGDLVQHLPERSATTPQAGPGTFADHAVEVREGTSSRRSWARSPGQVAPPPGRSAGSARGSSRPRGRRTGRSRARGSVARFARRRALAPGGGEDAALFAALVEEARAYRVRAPEADLRRSRARRGTCTADARAHLPRPDASPSSRTSSRNSGVDDRREGALDRRARARAGHRLARVRDLAAAPEPRSLTRCG